MVFPNKHIPAGLLAVALAFSAQFLTVRYNYGGNWTALFCTGRQFPAPPSLAKENLHVRPGAGYDGQFYHYMAHDPLLRSGLQEAIDAPRMRYRRILISALAAAGGPRYTDAALVAVNLGFVFLGAYWLAMWCTARDLAAGWGALFLFLPATLIGLDRLSVDLAPAAFCVALAVYTERGNRLALWMVLACALLARETGALLLGGYGLFLLLQRRWTQAVLFAGAAIPAAAWYFYVHTRTLTYDSHLGVGSDSVSLPVAAFFGRFVEPVHYPEASAMVNAAAVALDYVSLLGVGLAILLALRVFVRKNPDAVDLAGLGFLAMIALGGGIVGWYDAYGYPRLLSGLLLYLAMRAVERRNAWLALPLGLMLPRLAIPLASQAMGVFHGILGR
jgi:hypothetical protein